MSTETKEVAKINPAELTDPANLEITAQGRQAKALASSSLVPEAYRNNPANVMVAMELAHRIGASVMAVMQNLHVIQGKPSFSSSFLIACVNTCGRFSPLRFEFEGEGENYGCRAIATDKATAEECRGVLVTRAMAKAEGWSTKNGSKWRTMEELMLTYRSAAFWTRVYAPELTLGMHTSDEIEDITATVVPIITGPKPTRPTRLAAIAGDVPATDAAIEDDAPHVATGEGVEASGGVI
jgi:hypothetical protein